MKIRKLFKFEGSHIVRDCTSHRCSHSIHGHSYQVEIFIESSFLDFGQMVVDFGLLKGTVKDFIDSFDHTHVMWSREDMEDQGYFMKYDRWITLPCSPSAEMLSVMFFFVIDKIMKNTVFNNGESSPRLSAVRVHETDTGWAEANAADVQLLWQWDLSEIIISPSIKSEWKNPTMYEELIKRNFFINPKINLKYQ